MTIQLNSIENPRDYHIIGSFPQGSKPPSQRNSSNPRINAVNQVNGLESVTATLPNYSDAPNISSTSSNTFVHSRMDPLQNQLNQMLFMLQNNPQEFTTGTLSHMAVTHGSLHGGLYTLNSSPTSTLSTANSHISTTHLWHSRLGHPCF
ncbi:cysteine-rich receptor-like protein kinase 8 [Tanacetum coccineum]